MAETSVPSIKDFNFFFKIIFAYFVLQIMIIVLGPEEKVSTGAVVDKVARAEDPKKQLEKQRYTVSGFIFASIAMILFYITLVMFLDIPDYQINSIIFFVVFVSSLLKYLFDISLENYQFWVFIISFSSTFFDYYKIKNATLSQF